MSNVLRFGAVGDGVTDDTEAIKHAVANGDGMLNILDLVIIANMVLANDFNTIADMNDDGFLNILDLVLLVNIILEI